jgi:DNA-binding NarL/FixJ family response regulator
MNGMAVFDEILRLMPDVKVIMLSAQEKGDVVLELARKGISDYVIKDNSLMDNLLVSVKEIFEK